MTAARQFLHEEFSQANPGAGFLPLGRSGGRAAGGGRL